MKFLIVLVSLLILGCGNNNNPDPSNRMQIENRPLSVLDANSLLLGGLTFNLTLSATLVAPPTQDGYHLQANDIYVNGLDSFVSYNYSGPVRKGAVDHIITALATLPALGSELKMSDGEINGITKYNGSLYTVGEIDESLGGPAMLEKIPLFLGMLTPDSATNKVVTSLRSFAGTGVITKGSTLFAISGDGSGSDGGGLTTFNLSSMTQTGTTEIPNARGIDWNSGGTSGSGTNAVYVLSGKSSSSNSKIYKLSDAGAILSSIDLGSSANTVAQSKSTIQVGKTMILVSRGDEGFALYCAADGAKLAEMPGLVLTGHSPADTVTNSVTAGPGLIFAANGDAGVYVYQMKKNSSTASVCQGVTLTQLGNVGLGVSPVAGVGVSANQVKYAGLNILGQNTGVLYVAAGVAGFKLIDIVQTSDITDVLDFSN